MIKIDKKLLDDLSKNAVKSDRKRKNYNFHKSNNDFMQRMLNALEPETYIRPHKHENPDKNEVFIVLRGKILVIEYEDDGSISDYIILDRETDNYAAEIPPGRYHSMISLESGTVAYEMKEGPYRPEIEKKFAPWAPEESSGKEQEFMKNVMKKIFTE